MVAFQKDTADSWGNTALVVSPILLILGNIMRVDTGFEFTHLQIYTCLLMEAHHRLCVGASKAAPQQPMQCYFLKVLIHHRAAGCTMYPEWWRALRSWCLPALGVCAKVIPRGTMLRSVWLGGGWCVQRAHPALWRTRSFCSIHVWFLWCKLCKLRSFPGHGQDACVLSNSWMSN